MPNDQMPNYGVQTQYVSIRSASQKCKQIREKSNNGTALFISKPVKCQQQRENKENRRVEKRKKKDKKKEKKKERKKEEKRRKEKRREEQKIEEKRKKEKQIA